MFKNACHGSLCRPWHCHNWVLLIILTGSSINCFSKPDNDSLNTINTPDYISHNTNTLSTHPFGIFISRLIHNFQLEAEHKISLTFNISNGNVWLPYVKAYKPLNESDINEMKSMVWHWREAYFDPINSPSKTIEFSADGVIRLYQLNLSIPLSDQSELKLNSRAFSIDPGKVPYSLATSDQFIEWFHSHIHGGEDPFARKVYGLNQASISYTDENGKTLKLNRGDFIFAGIDLSYYYYPHFYSLKKRNLYTNFGFQMGVNLSKINPSLDLGLNTSLIKKINFKRKNELHLGASLGILCQKITQFGEGVQISSNRFFFS